MPQTYLKSKYILINFFYFGGGIFLSRSGNFKSYSLEVVDSLRGFKQAFCPNSVLIR